MCPYGMTTWTICTSNSVKRRSGEIHRSMTLLENEFMLSNDLDGSISDRHRRWSSCQYHRSTSERCDRFVKVLTVSHRNVWEIILCFVLRRLRSVDEVISLRSTVPRIKDCPASSASRLYWHSLHRCTRHTTLLYNSKFPFSKQKERRDSTDYLNQKSLALYFNMPSSLLFSAISSYSCWAWKNWCSTASISAIFFCTRLALAFWPSCLRNR